LDHLVGRGQQRFRDREAERFGGLEVDHKFQLSWLLDWQVGWLFTLEDAVDIAGGASPSAAGVPNKVALGYILHPGADQT
jgi:hypothetical protein